MCFGGGQGHTALSGRDWAQPNFGWAQSPANTRPQPSSPSQTLQPTPPAANKKTDSTSTEH